MVKQLVAGVYKSNNAYTTAVLIFFGIYFILEIILAGTGLYSVYLLNQLTTTPSENLRQEFLNALHFFDTTAAYVTSIFILCAISFSLWIYRANKNLSALNISSLEFTPGWAVGSFFIPVLSLYWPYKAVKEIWKGSSVDINNADWKSYPTPAIILTWWLFFIVACISARVVSTNLPPNSPSELYLFLAEIIGAQLLFAVATIFGMIIVTTINKRQLLKWNLLQSTKDIK